MLLMVSFWSTVRSGGEVGQDLLDHLDVGVLERLYLPEALWGWTVAVVGRVKDIVEPLHRFFEALVLAQVDGDRNRHVVEELPVVRRVGAAGSEVEVFHRVRFSHRLRG